MQDTQKFVHGDLVTIARDLGPKMRHFPAGKRAVVVGSCADLHGNYSKARDTRCYQLCVEGHGRTAWYDECQISLVEHGRRDLILEWVHE
jgi:hypothetical protein